MKNWARLERDLEANSQEVPEDLSNAFTLLWEDAIHFFMNLSVDRPRSGLFSRFRYRPDKVVSEISRESRLVFSRKDKETYQDLEQDLAAHLTQFNIERQFL